MKPLYAHYLQLADLLDYPQEGLGDRLRQIYPALDAGYPEAAEGLKQFERLIEPLSLPSLQELYLRTFDVQAITTLDVGYVLFGDDYKRGKLLVNLTREHRQAGVDCGSELADHLPNVLRLIATMQDQACRTELVKYIVAPALRKMILEFDPGRVDRKNQVYRKHHKTLLEAPPGYGIAYRWVLEAVYRVLKQDFNLEEPPPASSAQQGFLPAISGEMEIEPESH